MFIIILINKSCYIYLYLHRLSRLRCRCADRQLLARVVGTNYFHTYETNGFWPCSLHTCTVTSRWHHAIAMATPLCCFVVNKQAKMLLVSLVITIFRRGFEVTLFKLLMTTPWRADRNDRLVFHGYNYWALFVNCWIRLLIYLQCPDNTIDSCFENIKAFLRKICLIFKNIL